MDKVIEDPSSRPPWERPTPDPDIALRDWFAGMALKACITYQLTGHSERTTNEEMIAKQSYYYADAMLEAREPNG